jgi:hypothetical protein
MTFRGGRRAAPGSRFLGVTMARFFPGRIVASTGLAGLVLAGGAAGGCSDSDGSLASDSGLSGTGDSTRTYPAYGAEAGTNAVGETGTDATETSGSMNEAGDVGTGTTGGSLDGADGGSTGGSDGSDGGGSDGGGGGAADGGADVRTDGPADGSNGITPTQVCTSGVYWQGLPGPTMDPGDTCPSCHSTFQIAGTVYPTADEPTDCNGVPGDNLSVVITDADGNVQTLTVNDAGNFYSTQKVVFPFHAKVVSNTAERDMMVTQSTGDCNYCHSPTGLNGAPGRIMSP